MMKNPLLSLIALCLIQVSVQPAHSEFTVETVASGSGDFISLGFDGSDFALAYLSLSSLEYAEKINGTWSVTEVSGNGAAFPFKYHQGLSLVFDSGNNPHIFYYSYTKLRHAYRSDGVWSVEDVDTTNDTGGFPSATRCGQEWCVVYRDNTLQTLKFASGLTGNWTISTVSSATDGGNFARIFRDSEGTVWIADLDSTNDRVRVFRKNDVAWEQESVPATQPPSGGNLHFMTGFNGGPELLANSASFSETDAAITIWRYVRNPATGEWTVHEMSPQDSGGYPRGIVDSNNVVTIAYRHQSLSALFGNRRWMTRQSWFPNGTTSITCSYSNSNPSPNTDCDAVASDSTNSRGDEGCA